MIKSNLTRATVYLDQDIHKLLKMKAAQSSRSVSDLVNEAVRRDFAEDAQDLAAFEERVGEPTVTYEAMLKVLKADGKI